MYGSQRAVEGGLLIKGVGGKRDGEARTAEEVVAPPTVLIYPVPGECVCDNCHEGAHVGEGGPQAVVSRNVRGVELFRAGGPEAFAGI